MKLINFKGLTQPDPFIIKSGGVYYIYCTGIDGVHCYKSFDLFSGWKHVGISLSQSGQRDYWAPCVIERNGKFFMYYSSMPAATNDVHTENMKLAVSDTPDGKFTFVKNLIAPFSIDSHVVSNDAGLYMFYAVNKYDGDKVGTFIVVDKMKDEYNMCGSPVAVVGPSIDEEIFEKNRFKAGQDWYTIEGPCYFKKDGWHYCIYSANNYLKPDYHLGYAAVKSDSDDLTSLNFVKHSADKYVPLLCSDGDEISVGHNSLIEVDGELYIVYHGRDVSSDLSVDDRTARICKLIANNGTLKVEKL